MAAVDERLLTKRYLIDKIGFMNRNETKYILSKWKNFKGIRVTHRSETIPLNDDQFNKLLEKHSFEEYKNDYVSSVYLQLTHRCNFKCIHCFAADGLNNNLDEFSYEEVLKLLDECERCGVCSFILTGGEPTIHPHFMDIVREIYKRGMCVKEINTNGYTFTKEMVQELFDLDPSISMKISFDGIGTHEIIRRVKGSEKKALEAIQMCIDAGFKVVSQTQVNKITIDTLEQTLDLLDSIGVYKARLLKTMDTPRWVEGGYSEHFSFKDYYEECLKLTAKYLRKKRHMILYWWEFAQINPGRKSFVTGKFDDCSSDENFYNKPLCQFQKEIVAIGANEMFTLVFKLKATATI